MAANGKGVRATPERRGGVTSQPAVRHVCRGKARAGNGQEVLGAEEPLGAGRRVVAGPPRILGAGVVVAARVLGARGARVCAGGRGAQGGSLKVTRPRLPTC